MRITLDDLHKFPKNIVKQIAPRFRPSLPNDWEWNDTEPTHVIDPDSVKPKTSGLKFPKNWGKVTIPAGKDGNVSPEDFFDALLAPSPPKKATRKREAKPDPKESAIKKYVEDYLSRLGIPYSRINPCRLYTSKKEGKVGFAKIPTETLGSPDFLCCLDDGRAVAIETKRPTGRQSKSQIEWERKWTARKGIYVIVKRPEDLHQVFDQSALRH